MATCASVLLLIVTMTFCHSVPGDANYSDNEARILIIGAGAAGLQAARSLHDAGVDNFIIIEAADRIGGRMDITQRFPGTTMELGNAWESPAGSRVLKIFQDLGLNYSGNDYESLTLRTETGYDVTTEGLEYFKRLSLAEEKLALLQEKMRANSNIPDMSQRSALRVGGWIPDTAIAKTLEWYDLDFISGSTPETTSAKQTANSCADCLNYWITYEGGLKEVLDEVAGFLQEPKFLSHIRLNKKVESIDYTNDISVVVTCEDGTRYVGEYVLVTFSIGVLQHGLVEFIPPLPEWKLVEINKFEMSAWVNIYLSFSSRFWDDTEWILYISERRGYYPALFNYQAEGFFPDGTPTLAVTVTGDEARRVEAQSSAETKAEIQAVLRNMYGDNIPEATDILVTDWCQNPLTKGSFSNFPVEVTSECFLKLQSRVGRVFFGGEATSNDYFGYIDGALESGEREAIKILGCMNDFNECPIFEGEGLECEDSDGSACTLCCNAFLVGILVGLFCKGLYV